MSFIIFHHAATATAASSHNSVSLHTTFVFIVTSFLVLQNGEFQCVQHIIPFLVGSLSLSNQTKRQELRTSLTFAFCKQVTHKLCANVFSQLVFPDLFCFSPLSLSLPLTSFGTSSDSFLRRSKSSTIVPFRQILFQLKFQPNIPAGLIPLNLTLSKGLMGPLLYACYVLLFRPLFGWFRTSTELIAVIKLIHAPSTNILPILW